MRVNEGRYEFLRHLGTGMFSTTWLALDWMPPADRTSPLKYYAVKILTREGTDDHRNGIMKELAFHRVLNANRRIATIPQLIDDFEIQGPTGRHICLVFQPMGPNVATFRMSSPTKALRPYIVKKIITDVTEALEGLHENRIIHTDVKGNNVLCTTRMENEFIEEELLRTPPEIIGEFDLEDSKHFVYAESPLPAPCGWDVSHTHSGLYNYALIDLGQGQWVDRRPTVDVLSALIVRPPEILIGSALGARVDIWALGCLAFELLVGEWLFSPVDDGDDWTLEEDLLAQIFAITGQRFSSYSLSCARFMGGLLDAEGKLLRRKELPLTSFEDRLASYNILPEDEIEKAAKFLRKCLQLEMSDRPSASEILQDEWLCGSVVRRFEPGEDDSEEEEKKAPCPAPPSAESKKRKYSREEHECEEKDEERFDEGSDAPSSPTKRKCTGGNDVSSGGQSPYVLVPPRDTDPTSD